MLITETETEFFYKLYIYENHTRLIDLFHVETGEQGDLRAKTEQPWV